MDTLVLVERRADALEPVTHQLVAVGRRLAGPEGVVGALVLAAPDSSAVEAARALGADRVVAATHALLDDYNPEAWSRAAAAAVEALAPRVFLAAHAFEGMDVAPWVAARLGLPLVSNCSDLELREGELLATRPVFGSAWQVRLALPARTTVVASLARRGSIAPAAAPPCPVETLDVAAALDGVRTRAIGRVEPDAGSGDITKADVVVGVGRGIRDPTNLDLVEDLARALGGVVACSRPLVDLEWMPHDRQVGASGQEIAPKVYIACGISGAAQHLAGIRGAETIVAINRDPAAPLFGVSDYGVVGDLFEIVPALTAEARKRTAGAP